MYTWSKAILLQPISVWYRNREVHLLDGLLLQWSVLDRIEVIGILGWIDTAFETSLGTFYEFQNEPKYKKNYVTFISKAGLMQEKYYDLDSLIKFISYLWREKN